MSRRPPSLSGRSAAVFRQFLEGRPESLHPDDRQAASNFWDALGALDAPAVALPDERARPRRLWLAAAAAALAVVMVPAWWLLAPERTLHASYSARHGEVRSMRLSDGSIVRLGAESQIALSFSDGERRIDLLSGEAIFDVARDPKRPFIVATSAGEVRALGTSFMVRVGKDEARLVVIEGTVRVTPASEGNVDSNVSRIAKAGEMVDYGSSAADHSGTSQTFVTAVGPADVERSTAWTRGMLYFHGEPLGEVVDVVNRYAQQPIAVDDPALLDTPVFAAMRVGDTAAIEAITDQ